MKFTFVFSVALAALPLALASGSSSSSSTNSTSTTNSTEPAICYHLDGSEASDHVPCGSGDVVNCCNSNDICMSNGLCYQQGDRGMVLSRGSCTDYGWGNRCYAPCADYHRDGDMAIVNVGFESDEPEYCCGAVTVEDEGDDEVSCEYGGGPFHIQPGTAILNVAGLADREEDEGTDEHETEDSKDENDNDSNNVSLGLAVALGIGIPLGLLVMGGVLWAVWERRRRQLKSEEEGRGDAVMTALNLPRLHHRYGPIPSPVPSWSGRATPNQSGMLLHPVNSIPQSPPLSPPRVAEHSPLHADVHVDTDDEAHSPPGRR
ncbi:hypothetical protein BDV12DRAFT_145870 [Aspergillus spectabilis]